MTTLAIMKDRIARELRRTNITTFIAEAIATAIQAYQAERWHFDESRDHTFNTVANQEFYTSADASFLADLIKIDFAKLVIGVQVFTLYPDRPDTIESASSQEVMVGQPGWYVWYGMKFRLFPVPDNVYVVRIAGLYRYAAPASDAETGNFWMTDAEAVIRSRAKYELALHVLRDDGLAQTMSASTQEALSQLKRFTNKLTQGFNGRVIPMQY